MFFDRLDQVTEVINSRIDSEMVLACPSELDAVYTPISYARGNDTVVRYSLELDKYKGKNTKKGYQIVITRFGHSGRYELVHYVL
jgi:hypothetical protein